jgi:esterase/lipase superfamily enzyme
MKTLSGIARILRQRRKAILITLACLAIGASGLYWIAALGRAPDFADAPVTGSAGNPSQSASPQPPPPTPPPPPPPPPTPVPTPPPTMAKPPASTPAGSTSSPTINTARHRIYYGTDRVPLTAVGTFGTSPAVVEAGSGILRPLALGWCDVDVPLDRHRVGAVERPTWWTLDWRDWKEDPSRHFVIVKRSVDPDGFWPQVTRAASDDGVLVFIHGFNVAFDAAVFKTAQLAHDLEFHGAPILYSWASAATSRDYVADKERNEATVPLLKEFLVQLSARTPNTKIHVIAHSMGNRALIQALGQLAQEQRGPRLTEVIMAAPDVDRRVFLGLAPAFVRTAERITLYASGSDRVLQLAKQLERGPRAGDANPVLTFPGIESIDATVVSTDFLAHSYYSDPRLLGDISSLIKHNGGLPRFSIEGVPRVKPVWWRFLPES